MISTKLKKFKSNSWFRTILSKANRISQADQTHQAKFREIKTEANFKIRAISPIRKVTISQRAKILKRKLQFLKSAMTTTKIWSSIWIYKSNIQPLTQPSPPKLISNLLQPTTRNRNKLNKVKVSYSNIMSKQTKKHYQTK